MVSKNVKILKRTRRKARTRAKIFNISKYPRLSVFRSARYTYAQIIDDSKGKTLVSADSRMIKTKMKKTEVAELVGKTIAEKALHVGIKKVVFDRSHYKFHGRIKALAEAARKNGLQF